MILDNTNEKNAEILLRVAEPVSRIADDETMKKALEDVRGLVGKSQLVQTLGIIKLIPVFLKNHKQDLYEIIGALSDKTVEEVAQQNTRETIKTMQAVLRDEDIVGFFTLSENQTDESDKR